MQYGNWVPISKGFTCALPKDRPYTELEAAYCVQLDYDNVNTATVSGYADLWRWSRKKVKGFFMRLGIEIIYPENTQKKQNQRGQISIQIRDRSGTDRELIRLIDSRNLTKRRDRKGTEKGQKRDRSGSTTRDPNPNPDTRLCPQQQIVDLYHEVLPELPKVRVWSKERQSALSARWNQGVENGDGLKSNCIEWWEGFFRYIRKSNFLMGNSERNNDQRPFRADLEWIVKKNSFIKIVEGKYH